MSPPRRQRVMNGVLELSCYVCGLWLLPSGFHRNRGRADGRDSRCRECNAQRNREIRARIAAGLELPRPAPNKPGRKPEPISEARINELDAALRQAREERRGQVQTELVCLWCARSYESDVRRCAVCRGPLVAELVAA